MTFLINRPRCTSESPMKLGEDCPQILRQHWHLARRSHDLGRPLVPPRGACPAILRIQGHALESHFGIGQAPSIGRIPDPVPVEPGD